MQENTPHGRTAWDVLIVAIQSKLLLLLAIFFLVAIPLWLWFQAEPGSEVSLYGGFYKSQKSKKPVEAPVVSSGIPSTKGYVLPSVAGLQENAIPIFDGTINIARTQDGKFGSYYLSGANIDIINFAIRTSTGDSSPPVIVKDRVHVIPKDALVEVEYKGNFFQVKTEDQKGDEGSFVFSVSQVPGPTMKLKNIKQYSEGG